MSKTTKRLLAIIAVVAMILMSLTIVSKATDSETTAYNGADDAYNVNCSASNKKHVFDTATGLCTICGKKCTHHTTEIANNDAFVNGVCSICGYKCSHDSNTVVNGADDDVNSLMVNGICKKCGLSCTHKDVVYKNVAKATCETAGSAVLECKECSKILDNKVVLTKIGHTIVDPKDNTKSIDMPTKLDDYKEIKYFVADGKGDATLDSCLTQKTAATCAADATYAVTCNQCGEEIITLTDTGSSRLFVKYNEAIGNDCHSYSASNPDGKSELKCLLCGNTCKHLDVDISDPTKVVCNDCKYVCKHEGTIVAVSYDKKTNKGLEATCTSEGTYVQSTEDNTNVVTYWKCTKCDTYFNNKNGTVIATRNTDRDGNSITAVSNKEAAIEPALGHNFVVAGGTTGSVTCTECRAISCSHKWSDGSAKWQSNEAEPKYYDNSGDEVAEASAYAVPAGQCIYCLAAHQTDTPNDKHVWDVNYTFDGSGDATAVTATCKVCNATCSHNPVASAEVKATCTTVGVKADGTKCSICGAYDQSHAYKLVHQYDPNAQTYIAVSEPTCKKAGTIGLYCKECKKVDTDTVLATSTIAHTFVSAVKTPATCKVNRIDVEKCSVCGAEGAETEVQGTIDPNAHTLKRTLVAPATRTADGTAKVTCTECNYSSEVKIAKIDSVTLKADGTIKAVSADKTLVRGLDYKLVIREDKTTVVFQGSYEGKVVLKRATSAKGSKVVIGTKMKDGAIKITSITDGNKSLVRGYDYKLLIRGPKMTVVGINKYEGMKVRIDMSNITYTVDANGKYTVKDGNKVLSRGPEYRLVKNTIVRMTKVTVK